MAEGLREGEGKKEERWRRQIGEGSRKGERRISLPIFSFRLKPAMQTSSYAALIELTGLAE